ncbi:MAG: alpha/beta fold hydrolase [Deltaproteobacteria bacterium]|nr:alpha/beta fold hydrolase [Deltaproteobacteria bacterium]
MTKTQLPVRCGAALALCSLFVFALAAPHAEAAVGVARTEFVDCQSAYLDASFKLLQKRTGAMLKCADKLLACSLQEELAGGDFATCSAKLPTSCGRGFARLANVENATAAKLAIVCGELADYDFGSSVGLGFRRFQSECGAITTQAQATACFLSNLRCRAADIAESLHARTYELFNRIGLLAAYPETTSCLDARAGSPATGGDWKALAACQKGLTKTYARALYKMPRVLSRCLGGLLECQLRGDRLSLTVEQPPDCFASQDNNTACEKAHVAVNETLGTGILVDAADACADVPVADMLAGLGFGALCPGALTPTAVANCVRAAAVPISFLAIDETAPRTCQLSQEAPAALFTLGDFCAPECGNNVVDEGEICDDGNLDDLDECTNQCQTGPTTHQPVSIPSGAHPAHTPDGTPGNAVAPGGTLATQFGSTVFDLNNVSYLRYYAPAAGDPDAVMVLIPGFAGGSHSLKVVAETMVAKAAADGNIKLEVWTFDRRTDQLEDDAGAILAETEDDPELALNWYFGSELGLPLDPRLSRRAVFHDDSEVPFLANFTYNMFIHDIDAMIDTAHALASNPKVFLGGHSLGTLFSAHYAATDLDAGPGVVPGYTKVDGLVLFEGGGDSPNPTPPSDDMLDTIIARADGGLYFAIKNGDSRCYDGTACPGGDADCASLALPTGALTNKCIPPVDAYEKGAVTPQIHAVGDAISVQARRHPDSLSLAQVDFGSGSAIDNVPGLSILGFLPPASAEASVGFFLDDDYSVEVSFMASMGFSDNGPNSPLGDALLAGNSTSDPYRYWKNIEATMPPLAIPDNGPAVDAYLVNGQEKEITRLGNVLSMLRTGDRNIGDWYFPYSGLRSTWTGQEGFFTNGLDSSALSVTRGRSDIENLTEGASINIPVICFGGSNGISPTVGAFLPFAESVATCSAPSCTGTPRIVATDPINPTYGGADGGFEAYVSEGYAHIDIVSAEDDPAHNQVYDPLLAFLIRNTN